VVARAPGGAMKYISRIRHGESVSLIREAVALAPSVPAAL
jgi:hypothetical protein